MSNQDYTYGLLTDRIATQSQEIPQHFTVTEVSSPPIARHLYPSSARSIQSMPSHPTSSRSILILFSHRGLSLPNSPFPSGFPTKTCLHLSSPPCSAHIIHYLITKITFGDEYKSLSYSLCSLLQSRVILSLLGPNTVLSKLNVKNQVT